MPGNQLTPACTRHNRKLWFVMFTLILGGCASATGGTRKLVYGDLRTALISVDSVITHELKSDTIRRASVVQIQEIIRRHRSRAKGNAAGANDETSPWHVATLLDSIGKLADQLRQSMDSGTASSNGVRSLGALNITIHAGTVSDQSKATPCLNPWSHGDSISGVVVKGLHERVSGLCSLVESAQSTRLTWDSTTKPTFALSAADSGWQGVAMRDVKDLKECEAQQQTGLAEGETRVSRKVLRQVDSSFNELCRRVVRLVAAQRDTVRIQFKPDTQKEFEPGEGAPVKVWWLVASEQLWVEHYQFEAYRLAVHTRELVRVVVRQLKPQRDTQSDTIIQRTASALLGVDSRGRVLLGAHASAKGFHLLAGARAPLRAATGVVLEAGAGFAPQAIQDRSYALLGTLQYDTFRRRGGVGSTVLMPLSKRTDLAVSVSTLGEIGVQVKIPVYPGSR